MTPVHVPPGNASHALRMPRVSVIVPCFNYGRWLAECVESALDQASVDVDVTIVDDASTDDSIEVGNRLVARHGARVRLIHHATNRGHVASVNEALDLVSGEYIVKLDADDLLPVGSVGRAVALLEARPDVGFAYGRPLHFGTDVDAGLTKVRRWLRRASYLKTDHPRHHRFDVTVRHWTVWTGRSWIDQVCARGANCISQPEAVMRASAVRKVGPYRSSLPHTSDLGMWLALATVSDVGHVDGPIQGFYRVHANSMQRTVNAGKLRDLDGRLAAFEAVLGGDGAGHQPVDAPALLEKARARLAREALDEACRAYDRNRVETVPVDRLVDFALRAWPLARSTATWRALQARKRLGARGSSRFPPFLIQAALRPAKEELRVARWWRHGT